MYFAADWDFAEADFDGSVFTGAAALEKGLIDQLGYLDDAVSLAGALAACEGQIELMLYRRDNDRARSPYDVTPNMPLQHSEFLEDQESSVARYQHLLSEVDTALRPAYQPFLDSARRHRDVVARFGRFPHRNAILGRLDTPEEAAYLASGAPRFGTG